MSDIISPSYTLNRLDSVTFPGRSPQSYTYDDLMRLEQITASTLNYAYSYDNVSNLLTKTTGDGNYVYDYDDLSRLTSADNPTLDDEAYTYDGVGNRETASGVTGSITHNQNNELQLYGDISYEYDANGNMVSQTSASESWAYTYNVQNRLVQVEEDDLLIAEYGYDPFGRRLWKEVDGERTYFLYSDEGLVAEYDEEGNEIRSYGYRPDSTWGTDPLWLKENDEYYWYQNDHLGTPQKLIAGDGTVVWSAQYNAFGEADVQVETVTNNLRFPGQYDDAETGLSYNYHRYYDPKIGRYLRIDPIGFAGDDVNLYAYVWNNPTSRFDPLGLRNIMIKIYYHGQGLSDNVKAEVKRIFQECLSVKITWKWLLTDKTKEQCDELPLGKEVETDSTEATTYLSDATLPYGALGYTEPGGWIALIDRGRINNHAAAYDYDENITTGVVIAHEIGHHMMSEKKGHYWRYWLTKEHYVDLIVPSGAEGGVFSPAACKRLRKKLGID